MSVIEKL